MTDRPPDASPGANAGLATGRAPAVARRASRRAVGIGLVLLATLLVYAPSLSNDFTWDDRWAAMGHNGVARNALVAELQPLATYFETHYWPAKTPVSHTYRPVTVLTFALRHAAFGDDPRPAHLANVLLHVLATWLCYRLVRRLGTGRAAACVAALVFGVHAIHSEAVANVVGRAELLGFCFGAGGLLLAEAAGRPGARARLAAYAGAAAAFFLAFCSKESALAWVGFLPLYLLARGQPRGSSTPPAVRVGVATLTALLPAIAYLVLRAAVLSRLPGAEDPSIGYLENPLLHAPLATRLLTGTLVWGFGLWLTLLPFGLAADYGPCRLPIVSSCTEPWFAGTLLAAAALLAVLAGGLLHARRHPRLFLAAAAFLGFSFLATNLPLPVFMLFAERTYYTPSLALSLAVAWLLRRGLRPVPMLLLGCWVGASALHAVERCAVWRDDETLIRREVERHPDSVRMRLCAADLHAGRGDLAAARRHLEAAAQLDPDAPEPWLELGRLALRDGRPADAERALRNAALGRPRDAARIAAELRALRERAAAEAAASRAPAGSPR